MAEAEVTGYARVGLRHRLLDVNLDLWGWWRPIKHLILLNRSLYLHAPAVLLLEPSGSPQLNTFQFAGNDTARGENDLEASTTGQR